MFCSGCGTNNDDTARFCLKCGRPLSSSTPASTPPSTPSINLPPVNLPPEIPLTPPQVPLTPSPLPVLPVPPLPIPESLPPQVILGMPKAGLPLGMIGGLLFAVLAVAGIAFGLFYAATNVDRDSLPLIGKGKSGGGGGGYTGEILISLTSACKDAAGNDCNLIWDITGMSSEETGLRLEFEVRATGQGECAVAIQADQAMIAASQGAGRPGPFVEGARGRYYRLRNSEGITQSGGNLSCGQAQKGAWIFGAVTGESFVKLRYPGVPPARIELDAKSVRPLAAGDPLSVIPVQQTTCRTTQNQNCTGLWEIGPYGLSGDGTPIVFFAVRFDGPSGCQVPWQSDVAAHQGLVASGQRGIGLELGGNSGFLGLTSGGGLSQQNTPQPCGNVLTGFWRFAGGNVTNTVNLIYPDLPVVQVPIKP